MDAKSASQTRAVIERFKGSLLVAGVSGGPDSLALLHQLMTVLGPEALHVAHLDHGVRHNSVEEARRVEEVAGAWRLHFHSKRVDVPQLARSEHLSLEEAGREARYRYLVDVARKVGAGVVAVGHNADDQVETVLLHLLRGTGLAGLGGMQPVMPLPGAPELTLIRPLLGQSRAEIEAYCERHNLRPIADETNLDPTFLRNRIRHHLLPELATYNPQIRRNLLQLAEIASAEESLLQGLTGEVWQDLLEERGPGFLRLNRQKWRELPLALKRRTVRCAVELLEPGVRDLAFQTVQQAVEAAARRSSGSEFTLPRGLKMLIDYRSLIFSSNSADLSICVPQLQARASERLPVPGSLELADGWILTAEWAAPEPQEVVSNDNPWLAYVDLHGLDHLSVRGRLPGERMQPLGMDGRSAGLQDIMVNRKLASRMRARWPIVATEEHAVWLVGHVVDHRSRATAATQRFVLLSCQQMDRTTC